MSFVLATGGLGLFLTSQANAKAESLLRHDREALEGSLTDLSRQFMLLSLKTENDFATAESWALRPRDAGDAVRLRTFVSHAALLDYGAAIANLSGEVLNAYAVDPAGLPGPTDVGYAPLRAGLIAGGPGLSSVMTVNGVPVVALAVPIMVDNAPQAVLLGYFRADRSALQTYIRQLHFGRTGQGYLFDSQGGIIAASDPAKVGQNYNSPAVLRRLAAGRGSMELRRGGTEMLTSYSPIRLGSWAGTIEQNVNEFYGPVRSGYLRIGLATLGLLAVAAALIAALNHKRQVARQRFQDELAHQAYHDPLTGLPNRVAFWNQTRVALAAVERYGGGVAVLYLDLDRFKVVNDSLGHDVGDQLLSAVAARLAVCVRANDVLARIGGDEFTVLMGGVIDPIDAIRTARRLIEEINQPFLISGNEAAVSVSIGIVLGTGLNTEQELLRNADLAMYRAKAQGGSRYELFEHELAERAERRLVAESDLRRALDVGEFVLFYQPQVQLDSGRVVGVEALVRWEHPERGLLLPNEFVPLAEETDLIVPLGRWVLFEATRQAHDWAVSNGGELPCKISVNVSGRQLARGDAFVAEVRDALRAADLPAGSLILELTETVIVDGGESLTATIDELQALGVKLAIDDFGTGYSSLSDLKNFPLANLKLDSSFVDGVAVDAADAAIARAVVQLAHSLDLTVTAEGIETTAQLAALCSMGCDDGQGFYVWKPMSAPAIASLLARAAPRVARSRGRQAVAS